MPVFQEMHLFLEKIRFNDFTIVDVLTPKSHRLQRMLSVVYNYKLFRDTAFAQFEMLAQDAVRHTSQKPCRIAKELMPCSIGGQDSDI